MASASDHRAHAALQPADCLVLLPQRLPAAVETSIGPAHYPGECTQSDAFLQPSLRARKGRANSNSLAARNGISAWSTSTTPSSGSRWGSIIDRRSFCASNQAVLYVMPSWASNWSADMPFEWVAIRCAAQNHTVSGNLDRCITVPAVIDV